MDQYNIENTESTENTEKVSAVKRKALKRSIVCAIAFIVITNILFSAQTVAYFTSNVQSNMNHISTDKLDIQLLDTMINESWDIKKINSVYNVYGGGEKGIQALYKEVAQLVGFEPDFRVIVEWEAVGKLGDAIGGVYFDVPYNMDYHDPYQDLVIEQAKGYRLLNGDDAMQVIRWRKNDADSP